MLKLIVFFLILISLTTHAKIVKYEITATKAPVNMSGKQNVDFALLLNDQIPGPTLEFTEGDDAEIVVKNRIPDEELSIHWHGILLPPEMDGVPYVTTPSIHSGKDLTFKFKIRQHGTFWYHSHTSVQEQKGIYGAIVIHPKEKIIKYDKDIVVILSDWSDEKADQILENLRKDGEFYRYKKDRVRSWLGATQAGKLSTYLGNEWTRMGGMDLSDVGYDAFLINGKKELQLSNAMPGQKIRLRIINAGASTYFYISLGQTPMKLISADGVDIEPVLAKEFLIGLAETYDVLFEPPAHKNYELRVSAQDGTGAASGWIGMGEKVLAPNRPDPDLYASMSASHDMAAMTDKGSQSHDMQAMPTMTAGHEGHVGKMETSPQKNMQATPIVNSLTVDDLRALKNTELPKNKQTYDLKLVLDGDMERYVWIINGKAIHEERNIFINEGDIVRFTFENLTMMHHPMHLHGHFFRVLNKNGSFSPLKHTVDIPPMMNRTIEFYANEPGEWMLHCHNLYHLKTGMARVVKYMSYQPSKETLEFQKNDPHKMDHAYFYGFTEVATNHAQAYLRWSETWNEYIIRGESRNTSKKSFEYNQPWEFEGDLLYRRWHGRFFNLAAGLTTFEKEGRALAGIGYIFPMLVRTQVFIDHKGKFRLDLEKRFQWTKNILTDVEYTLRPGANSNLVEESEYEISLMYAPNWRWAAGLMQTNNSLGAGLQIQF